MVIFSLFRIDVRVLLSLSICKQNLPGESKQTGNWTKLDFPVMNIEPKLQLQFPEPDNRFWECIILEPENKNVIPGKLIKYANGIFEIYKMFQLKAYKFTEILIS